MLGKAIQPEIEAMVAAGQYDQLREILCDGLNRADIAEILADLADKDEALLFRLLPTNKAADVFELLEFDDQETLLRQLSQEHIGQILNEMSPDDRTQLFEELPGKVTQRLLKMLNPEELRVARTLLGYPEDSIGRLMTPEYIAVRPDWTVSQTLDTIRKNAPRVETINVIYIVDQNHRLIDDLRIGQLLLADPEDLIGKLSDEQFTSLLATDDQEEAIEAFKKYDRVALPVIDRRGILVGIVTVDDVFDVAEEEETEDVQKFGGQMALEDPYFSTPLRELAFKRAGWLALLLVGSCFTAIFMLHFEKNMAALAILAIFIPMIISSGGNSGSQSAAVIIRGIAVHEIEMGDWWKVFVRELLMGLSLGLMLGVMAFGFALLIGDESSQPVDPNGQTAAQVQSADNDAPMLSKRPNPVVLGVLVMLSITAIVSIGTLLGSMLPFIFKSMGFDPAVCSGPFIATFVDVAGIVLYLLLAQWLLRLYA